MKRSSASLDARAQRASRRCASSSSPRTPSGAPGASGAFVDSAPLSGPGPGVGSSSSVCSGGCPPRRRGEPRAGSPWLPRVGVCAHRPRLFLRSPPSLGRGARRASRGRPRRHRLAGARAPGHDRDPAPAAAPRPTSPARRPARGAVPLGYRGSSDPVVSGRAPVPGSSPEVARLPMRTLTPCARASSDTRRQRPGGRVLGASGPRRRDEGALREALPWGTQPGCRLQAGRSHGVARGRPRGSGRRSRRGPRGMEAGPGLPLGGRMRSFVPASTRRARSGSKVGGRTAESPTPSGWKPTSSWPAMLILLLVMGGPFFVAPTFGDTKRVLAHAPDAPSWRSVDQGRRRRPREGTDGGSGGDAAQDPGR